jgi:hypothetical protein
MDRLFPAGLVPIKTRLRAICTQAGNCQALDRGRSQKAFDGAEPPQDAATYINEALQFTNDRVGIGSVVGELRS